MQTFQNMLVHAWPPVQKNKNPHARHGIVAFENFSQHIVPTNKTSVAFENFSTTPYRKLSKTRLPCMAIHAQKQNLLLLFVGRRSLLPNGATPRSDPAEHVLPIIQRLY
jgi:hypothetical protein